MIAQSGKRCKTCGVFQPPENFYAASWKPGTLQAECKTCWRMRNKGWLRNKLHQDPSYLADQSRKKRYGLTKDELEMWLSVPVCQIPGCGYVFKHDGDVNFDHDHERGHVRGVLCNIHNRSLISEKKGGMPTMQNLAAMMDYLARDNERVDEQARTS